jgi:DNA-binding CsgD family transcriptional regulator
VDGSCLTRDIEALGRSGQTFRELIVAAGATISRRVRFDSFCAATFDPISMVPTWTVRHARVPSQLVARWVAIENTMPQHFNIADIPQRGQVRTSLLSKETDGVLERSVRYREIYRLVELQHELRVLLRAGGLVWGGLSLMRDLDEPDFDRDEVALVGGVATKLAEALRRTFLTGPTMHAREVAPAVIILSSDDRVASATAAAESLLEELADMGAPDPERLPSAVRVVVLRARGAHGGAGAATASVRTPAGRWLTVRAAVLDGGEHVAVVIEPTAPGEAATLILAAYGLSAREIEIAQGVRRGLSTEDIGTLLGISEYTVQDHLKSIFDKTGMGSRKELAARLFFSAGL